MSKQQTQPERAGVQAIARNRRTVRSLMSSPKALFFLAAGLSFVMSVSLFFTGSREQGIYVGIWVPSILSAGALLLGDSRDE